MIIAIDIDNTVAQTVRPLVRHFGEKILQTYYIFPDRRQEEAFFGQHKDLFEDLQPYHRAPEILQGLAKKGWKIIYLTSRNEAVRATTIRWLLAKGFPQGDVIFTPNKAGVLRSIRPWALIEDAPHHIEAAAYLTKVLIKDQPYNRHLPGHRFSRWAEIPSLLRKVGSA